jgi:hypothetical protein
LCLDAWAKVVPNDVALDQVLEEGRSMGKVEQASMSLDGFIADTNDQVGPLFDWLATETLNW